MGCKYGERVGVFVWVTIFCRLQSPLPKFLLNMQPLFYSW